MRTDLVLDALRMALTRRPAGADVQLIHHSHAGTQYTSFAFNQVLDDHGVLASIGTVGDAYDNAMAESFVDSFKTELIADRIWCTRTPTRASDRRMGRVVQQHEVARSARRPSPGGGGGSLRDSVRSDSLSQSMKRGTHKPSLRGTQPGSSDRHGDRGTKATHM
jgi:hypothetical protein